MILAQAIQVARFMTVKQVNKTAPKIGKPSCNSTESTLHPVIQLPDSNHRDLSTSHLVPNVSKYILQPIHLTFFKHFKLSFISSNRQTKLNTAWPCGHFEALLWQLPIPPGSVSVAAIVEISWNIWINHDTSKKHLAGWIGSLETFGT